MKRAIPVALLLITLAIGFAAGRWGLPHKPGAAEPAGSTAESPAAVVVAVTTAPIRRAKLDENIVAYGLVSSRPGEVRVISVPFEAYIDRVLVSAGQKVRAGERLVDILPSPAAGLELAQAKAESDATGKELADTEQRFRQKLATNQELLDAQRKHRAAQLTLASLAARGTGRRSLQADGAGVVNKVDVAQRQLVPSGGPMVEIANDDFIQAKVGVEPEEVRFVAVGQPVALEWVHFQGEASATGKVELVTERVNPETRLVDVFVSFPAGKQRWLDGFVRAAIAAESHEGLVVPREAIVTSADGYAVFTVADGRAVRHEVTVGVENKSSVEVIAEGLKEGDPVVVVGSFEIEDGSAVATRSAL